MNFFATTIGLRIYPGTMLEKQTKDAGLMKSDFSWVKDKPNPLRYLFFEFEDQQILIQKELGYFKLSIILWKLVFNGTVGSLNFIWELVVINLHKLLKLFPRSLRTISYKIKRIWH
jgi:hypothetical protein